MQATRRARLQSVILQELSSVVPRSVKDPRVPPITFTRAEVTEDGSQATVFVTLLGGGTTDRNGNELSEEQIQQKVQGCLEGLASASGFLRRHLGDVLDIKFIPKLLFREDRGIANVSRVHDLLKEIEGKKPAGSDSSSSNKKSD
jgi:ribosome-binding factor A